MRRKVRSVLLSLLIICSMVAPFVGFSSETSQATGIEKAGYYSINNENNLAVSLETDTSANVSYGVGNSGDLVRLVDGTPDWNASVASTIGHVELNKSGSPIIGTNAGEIRKYDNNGNLIWQNSISGQFIYALEFGPNDNLGVADSNGNVWLINPENGNIIWEKSLGSSQTRGVAVSDNYVFASQNDQLHKLEKSSGDILNQKNVGTGLRELQISGDNIVSTSDAGVELRKISNISTVVWDNGGTVTEGINKAMPIPDENIMVAIGRQGTLFKFNLSNGETLQTTSLSEGNSMSLNSDGSRVYVATGSDTGDNFQAYNTSTFNKIWGYQYGDFTKDIAGYGDYKVSSAAAKRGLAGRVVSDSGDPVSNATVRLAYGSNPSPIKQRQNLTKLSDPTPEIFTNWRQRAPVLLGDSSVLADNGSVDRYPLIYETADLGLTYQDDADLSSPKTLQLTPGQRYALLIGNTGGCGLGEITNEYNRQVPGCVANSGEVTVERLSPSGEVVSSTNVEVSDSNRLDIPGATEVSYAEFQFQTGYYRVSVANEENSYSYPVQVGSPLPEFDDALQSQQETLTDYAKQIRDARDGGGLTIKRVVTNDTGAFTADVDSSASVVSVSASKAPGVNIDPRNLTQDKIRDSFNEGVDENASVYYPSQTKRVQPPANNVTLTMREVATPRDGNLTRIKNRLEQLENQLFNGSLANLPPVLQDRLENIDRDRLESIYGDLADLVRSNDALREAYLEKSQFTEVRPASELSRPALEREVVLMHEALNELQDGGELIPPIEIEPPDVERGNDTVSLTWSTPADLSDQNVTAKVFVDYSNGTSRVVNESFVQVDNSIVGNDQIRLVNYPLNRTDPAAANFRLRIVGAEGIGGEETPVRNPTFGGNIPGLDAIRLSSIEPGPNDRVTVTTLPERGSGFGELVNATAYGPSGQQIDTSNVTAGKSASFTTAGEGTHRIELVIENDGGTQFTEVLTVRAASTDEARPPSLYARESVLGSYALVGDGLESGGVDVEQDDVTLTATLPEDGEPPSSVHIYAEGLSLPAQSEGLFDSPDTEVQTRIVRGQDRSSIQSHVTTYVHLRSLPSEAIVYRQEDQPLPSDESNKYGRTDIRSNSTTIATYTEADGTVDLSVTSQPGRVTEFFYDVRTSSVGEFLPLVTQTGAMSPVPVGPLLAVDDTAATLGGVLS